MSQDCLCIVKLRHRNVKIAHWEDIYCELTPDSEIKKFIIDEEANKFLVPEYRAPWVLPKI